MRGLRRNPAAVGHLGNLQVEWCEGDLKDPSALERAMRGVEIVFHAAGYYPTRKDRRSVSQQVQYAQNEIEGILNAAKRSGIDRLIYTSTLTTIGHPPSGATRLANENDQYMPGSMARSGYYEAKYAMEKAVLSYQDGDFAVVVLNPTAVFGPGDIHLTLGGLLLAVARRQAIFWLPASINVVDVRDVAAAHLQAARYGRPGERYILGGHNLSVKAILFQTAEVAGVSPPRFELPLWVLDLFVAVDDALPSINLTGNHLRAVRHWQFYDNSKAVAELNLAPRPFDQTMRDALDWFRANNYL